MTEDNQNEPLTVKNWGPRGFAVFRGNQPVSPAMPFDDAQRRLAAMQAELKRWGLVEFGGRWVAEYGWWPPGGVLQAAGCDGIAFIVADDRQAAEAILQQMNDRQMEPPSPLGVVGQVDDGVAWLGPADCAVRLEWLGRG